MHNEILDTRKAFQTRSGYFGWMVIPDVQIVTGDLDMNERQKVIEAINHYETRIAEHLQQQQVLRVASDLEKEAEAELLRTLRAVYGGRSAKGVVLRGKKYSAVQVCTSGAHELQVAEADFEVLG